MEFTNLLKTIFDNSRPKYTSFQFSEMINVGLVLLGKKRGAIVKLKSNGINALKRAGFYAEPYPFMPELTFIAKTNPHFSKNVTHKEVGRALSYFTPIDINYTPKQSYGVHIIITFQRKNGRKLLSYVLSQLVIDKSEEEIINYLQPFVDTIESMKIPNEFHILDIAIEITAS